MDFIEGLPKSEGYDTILVVVDKFSKFAKFIPLSHPFTALQVATAFIKNVYDIFGMPQVIISDRDKIFTSALWQELFKLADVKLNMSSSYHPQTDGQTERLNQCLEAYLRCAVHSCPKHWSKWLSQVQHWYNTAYHSALDKSPYEVLFARKPTPFGLIDVGDSMVPDVHVWLQERAHMNEVLHQQLTRAQQRMKYQADKHRSKRVFNVGDMVYLKLQPYVQMSVAKRSCQKLCFRYFGPYKILERIGEVAYKLDLPPQSQVHPVVHVSLLKKAIRPDVQVQADLPASCMAEDAAIFPEEILHRQLIKRGNAAVPYGLVRWTGLPAALATWENL
uniref:Retrotransposon protein, putative, unclassified n=3 Tax=Oryza sativa subsp. japonica TaxID=39947 RepID=Q2R8M3_ORYSJ|nr:retrotransposon protein, putative, unclassified [Oryza sativa Japonica Group]ABA92196.1 retrotransposon protein, putative, unclassified, expressed [Oryza sativa Japonica Group]